MSKAWKAYQFFLKLFPGWEVSAIDATGRSGRFLFIWNPAMCDFKSYSSFASLLLVGHIKGFEEEITLLNIYGPYKDRESFWL